MSTQFETIYITLYATKNGKNIKQIPWQLVVGIEQNIFVPRITTSHIYGHFHSNLGLLLNINRFELLRYTNSKNSINGKYIIHFEDKNE